MSRLLLVLLAAVAATAGATEQSCDASAFQRGIDFKKTFFDLAGAPVVQTLEGEEACLLSWDVVGKQIREARAAAPGKAVTGHFISVNGRPRFDSTPPGVYVNRPTATHKVADFHLDVAYKLAGKEKQYTCAWTSEITLLPAAEVPRQATESARLEPLRQQEYCDCPLLRTCLDQPFRDPCKWKRWTNILRTPSTPGMFCFPHLCTLTFLPGGKVIDVDGPVASQCEQVWTEGTAKKDWYFDVRSFAFDPRAIHRKGKTFDGLETLPRTTFPDRLSGMEQRRVERELRNPRKWRCTWTQVRFYKYGLPDNDELPKGKDPRDAELHWKLCQHSGRSDELHGNPFEVPAAEEKAEEKGEEQARKAAKPLWMARILK